MNSSNTNMFNTISYDPIILMKDEVWFSYNIVTGKRRELKYFQGDTLIDYRTEVRLKAGNIILVNIDTGKIIQSIIGERIDGLVTFRDKTKYFTTYKTKYLTVKIGTLFRVYEYKDRQLIDTGRFVDKN